MIYIMIQGCEYCDSKEKLLEHHIRYNPKETIYVCKSCHWQITKMIRSHMKSKTYLCVKCGRHYTSRNDMICYYCQPENQDKQDCFGLTSKDKTKPIFRYKITS